MKAYPSIFAVQHFPTVVDNQHESLFRAYHILQIVEWLLKENAPPLVVLALLTEMRHLPNSFKDSPEAK